MAICCYTTYPNTEYNRAENNLQSHFSERNTISLNSNMCNNAVKAVYEQTMR